MSGDHLIPALLSGLVPALLPGHVVTLLARNSSGNISTLLEIVTSHDKLFLLVKEIH